MTIIDNDNFYIKCTKDVDEEHLLNTAKSYDQYIEAIDNGYFEAKRKNENLIAYMKGMGVVSFVVKDYLPMYSDTKRNWGLIDLVED